MKKYQCEVCTKRFPLSLSYLEKDAEKVVNLIDDLDLPDENPYMVLEGLPHSKTTNSQRGVYVLKAS